jgi:hypothetical protein
VAIQVTMQVPYCVMRAASRSTDRQDNRYAVHRQCAHGARDRHAGRVDRVMLGGILDARLTDKAFYGCESASVEHSSPSSTSAAARWPGWHR